jgi:NAD(P)-dependent dehydrogenase (short-subunit alcohol dehydrogenase family)
MRRWRPKLARLWRRLLDLSCYVLAGIGVVMFALGSWGFYQYGATGDSGWGVTGSVYRALQLFIAESGSLEPPLPLGLEVARFGAPFVTVALSVAAIAQGLSRFILRFRRGHVLVCGLGRKGLLFAQAFHRDGMKVVAVDRDPNAEGVGGVRLMGIRFVQADASDEELFKQVGANAKRVIAVTGDDMANVKLLRRAEKEDSKIAAERTASAHVRTGDLFDLLCAQQVANSTRTGLFNIYEQGAWALLTELPPFMRRPGAKDPPTPHVAVLGVGEMGGRLITQLGRTWSAYRTSESTRLRIVLVDIEAAKRKDFLLAQHPQLAKVCDLVCLDDMDVRSQQFNGGAVLVDPKLGSPSTVYVCFDDDERALATALTVQLHGGLGESTQIIVIVEDEKGAEELLRSNSASRKAKTGRVAEGCEAVTTHGDSPAAAGRPPKIGPPKIVPFSILTRTCIPELLDNCWKELVARAISNHYEEHLGGRLRLWRDLTEEDREKNRDAADCVPHLLEEIGCVMVPARMWGQRVRVLAGDEVETMAQLEHHRYKDWMETRGWTYGPRSKEKKTNPSLVLWEKLDNHNRDFARAQVRLLPAALAQAGYVIESRPG